MVAPASTGGTVAGQGQGDPAPQPIAVSAPGAPQPTESRPARKPRAPRADTQPDPIAKPRSRSRKPKDQA
jgi:NADH-quinone oxidoreductase subunit C